MIPEYLTLFSGTGEVDVEVSFIDCAGMVSHRRMRAEEVLRLVDSEHDGFVTRMSFDEIPFEIAKYEIDPVHKRLTIHARMAHREDVRDGSFTIFDLTGRNKADLLAKLYNASRAQGLGYLEFDPADMGIEEAQALIDSGKTWFDYVKGRVMKVRIDGHTLDVTLFDNYYGAGSAAAIING